MSEGGENPQDVKGEKSKAEPQSEPMFKNISAEDSALEVTEIESLCVNCEDNGMTKLLLTKIPHYREVILMSFFCENCGFQNNEIQSGGRIQEQGVQFKVKIQDAKDMGRQVVKSDSATLSVPEIGLEIPSDSQKGAITTVEGVLQRTVAGLQQDQAVRRVTDPDGAGQIDDFCKKVEVLMEQKNEPFTLILRDPSGNSFVENLLAPHTDPKREVTYFTRTRAEDHALAIYTQEELREEGEAEEPTASGDAEDDALTGEKLENEVLRFATNCPDCNAPADTNMKVTKIPHFKEVVIMATVCDFCGHKTNEVKAGSGIEPKGAKITLKITDSTDLSRDVLKSETCDVALPDLDFRIGGHALGGRFTTLEGLLQNILEKVENNPFLGTASASGDSNTRETQGRLEEFIKKLEELKGGNKEFTFIMDDPAGNSYLQNLYAPDPDPEMSVEHYQRTFDQDDDLGINDMKTENYGEREILASETAPLNPTQQAHLVELGASSSQKHLYVKDDKNLLSPGHIATNENRRVSATKSTKSTNSSVPGSEGGCQ